MDLAFLLLVNLGEGDAIDTASSDVGLLLGRGE